MPLNYLAVLEHLCYLLRNEIKSDIYKEDLQDKIRIILSLKPSTEDVIILNKPIRLQKISWEITQIANLV